MIDIEQFRGDLLADTHLWTQIRWISSTGSTNADLAASARDGAPMGSVLISDEQTAGRGRFARQWSSPPGTSLSISALLRPAFTVGWSAASLVTGLAVTQALAGLGAPASLKWPNDVLLRVDDGDRKVCGILSEIVRTPDAPALVIGIGINVSQRADQLPVDTATSLALAGCAASTAEVATAVLRALDAALTHWMRGDDLRSAYRTHCSTLGRRVRVQLEGDNSFSGVAEDISDDGTLIVATAGARRRVAAGDVIHLRPGE